MNSKSNQEQSEVRKLIPVTQWKKYHPWPSVAGLRHLIFHEHSNGFSICVRRIGRRVLIDEGEFFRWADELNSTNNDLQSNGKNEEELRR